MAGEAMSRAHPNQRADRVRHTCEFAGAEEANIHSMKTLLCIVYLHPAHSAQQRWDKESPRPQDLHEARPLGSYSTPLREKCRTSANIYTEKAC